MTKREKSLLLLLVGLAGIAAFIKFTKQGQTVAASGGEILSSGVQKLIDLSDSTLQLIKSFEGFSATAYPDARGWSIGYGHYMGPSPTMATINEADAYAMLKNDVQTAADAVKSAIQVPLTQNQFDALVSFAYNVGVNAFRNSTLAKKVNANDPTAVNEFSRWTRSNGQQVAALVQRRAVEAQLFAGA